MLGSSLQGHTLDSYIGSTGIMGYFFLAQDADDRWYWAQADDEQSDPYTATFCGPWKSRGLAIISAEDWVAITQI